MKRRETYLKDEEVLAYLQKLDAGESDCDYQSDSSSDDEPVSH